MNDGLWRHISAGEYQLLGFVRAAAMEGSPVMSDWRDGRAIGILHNSTKARESISGQLSYPIIGALVRFGLCDRIASLDRVLSKSSA
jgi:hypothetical protein